MSKPDPLVIVLGAGASKEVGLPIGSELTKSIAESLNFKVDDFRHLAGGDDQIRECTYKLGQDKRDANGSVNDYYQAALKIRDSMQLAPSIDNFIDSHRVDTKIAQMGKLAIAACILKAEKKSTLYVDRSNSYNKPNFTKLKETWFAELFSLFSQHCVSEELEERLSRLTIISFNYDRCFKFFLRYALLTYYSISPTEADRIASKVTVLHPYGSVGDLRFDSGGQGIEYGGQPASHELLRSADTIRTFTESTDDDETTAVRECIANAKTLVYLGFAFHPLNIKLLYGPASPPANSRDCDVFATAMGISDSNRSLIAHDLVRMGGYPNPRVHLHHHLTAGGLIAEYSRHLARSLHSAV